MSMKITIQNKRKASPVGLAFAYSEGKILIVVFFEIQGLCLDGNPFTGIVLKLPAGFVSGDDAFFDAKDLIAIDGGAVGAVSAVALDLFPKQHKYYLESFVSFIIHPAAPNCYCEFWKI